MNALCILLLAAQAVASNVSVPAPTIGPSPSPAAPSLLPGDETDPGFVIAGFGVVANSETSDGLTLEWTSPNGYGNGQPVSAYFLRYSLSGAIATEDDFNAAIPIDLGGLVPSDPGVIESFTVSGLPSGTLCHFGLRASLEGDPATMSEVASTQGTTLGDLVKPAPIGGLVLLDAGPSSAMVRWIASGDDAMVGTAASVDLRISTSPISQAGWDAAGVMLVENEPLPAAAGMEQSMTIPGLEGETTYYVAIRAVDEAGNLGDLAAFSMIVFTTAGGNGAGSDGGESPATCSTRAVPAGFAVALLAVFILLCTLQPRRLSAGAPGSGSSRSL